MKIKALLLIIVSYYSLFPSVLTVPDEYSTIQQALDSASSSDTILVAPGTYKENLVWPVTSGLSLLSAKGADQTVIEAKDSGSVCGINSGVEKTLICGFTFYKGRAAGT